MKSFEITKKVRKLAETNDSRHLAKKLFHTPFRSKILGYQSNLNIAKH
jgi:hypothetical protein